MICVVAVCRECRQAVIFKYISNGTASNVVIPSGTCSGLPLRVSCNIEWCECGSLEPRCLCKVGEYDTPGFLDKCEKCEFRFACASSRIVVVNNGSK